MQIDGAHKTCQVFTQNNIGQVFKYPFPWAVLTCLGEARPAALCATPTLTSPKSPIDNYPKFFLGIWGRLGSFQG